MLSVRYQEKHDKADDDDDDDDDDIIRHGQKRTTIVPQACKGNICDVGYNSPAA
jgi:hypothetical protein